MTGPTHIRVARTHTYVYDVALTDYPDMTPDQAKQYEMGLEPDEVDEVLAELIPTKVVVTAGVINKEAMNGEGKAREVRSTVSTDGDDADEVSQREAEDAVKAALRKAGLGE